MASINELFVLTLFLGISASYPFKKEYIAAQPSSLVPKITITQSEYHGQEHNQQNDGDKFKQGQTKQEKLYSKPHLNTPMTPQLLNRPIQPALKNRIAQATPVIKSPHIEGYSFQSLSNNILSSVINNPAYSYDYKIQHLVSRNPKIKDVITTTKHKKRYLVIHPNGDVEHVDELAPLVANHPHYFLLQKDSTIEQSEAKSISQNPVSTSNASATQASLLRQETSNILKTSTQKLPERDPKIPKMFKPVKPAINIIPSIQNPERRTTATTNVVIKPTTDSVLSESEQITTAQPISTVTPSLKVISDTYTELITCDNPKTDVERFELIGNPDTETIIQTLLNNEPKNKIPNKKPRAIEYVELPRALISPLKSTYIFESLTNKDIATGVDVEEFKVNEAEKRKNAQTECDTNVSDINKDPNTDSGYVNERTNPVFSITTSHSLSNGKENILFKVIDTSFLEELLEKVPISGIYIYLTPKIIEDLNSY